MLTRMPGDQHRFSIDSPTLADVRRSYERFSDAAFEEDISRICCGIHFRTAMNEGLSQGRRIADHAVDQLLRQQL